MNLDPRMEAILKETAKEMGLTQGQAYEIWYLLGQFCKDIYKKGNVEDPSSFKSIYIKGLGTLYPSNYRINKIKTARDKRKK